MHAIFIGVFILNIPLHLHKNASVYEYMYEMKTNVQETPEGFNSVNYSIQQGLDWRKVAPEGTNTLQREKEFLTGWGLERTETMAFESAHSWLPISSLVRWHGEGPASSLHLSSIKYSAEYFKWTGSQVDPHSFLPLYQFPVFFLSYKACLCGQEDPIAMAGICNPQGWKSHTTSSVANGFDLDIFLCTFWPHNAVPYSSSGGSYSGRG